MSNETFSSKLRTGTGNLSDLFIASQLGREASDNESQFKVNTPVLFIRMRNALPIIWTSFVHDFSRGACFFFFSSKVTSASILLKSPSGYSDLKPARAFALASLEILLALSDCSHFSPFYWLSTIKMAVLLIIAARSDHKAYFKEPIRKF